MTAVHSHFIQVFDDTHEEPYHQCYMGCDKFPESEMLYNPSTGEWIRKSKVELYLASFGLNTAETEVIRKELQTNKI